jgi:hypothetical protein
LRLRARQAHQRFRAAIVDRVSLIVGFPGDSGVRSQDGLTWSTIGRAGVDVDVDINRQPGQVATG